MTTIKPPLIGGRPIEAWDREWKAVDGGLKDYQPQLRHLAGLYRASLGGRVMAIGTGTDKDGGLAKRLSDFRRDSQSGRDHYAGKLIHEHLDGLVVEVLITGSDPQAREVARQLKTPMIGLHAPAWTAPNAPFMRRDDLPYRSGRG